MLSCRICAKVFSRADNLKRHQKLHGDNQEDGLKRHLRTHSTGSSKRNKVEENAESSTDTEYGCVDEVSTSKFLQEEPSSLDIAMHSVMSNQEMNFRDKMKCYLKTVGHHLRCKPANCVEDEANSDTSEDKHDRSSGENQSGNGTSRDIFGGALLDSMEHDASEEVSKSEAEESDAELEDTDDASNEDDVGNESEESVESKEDTLESADVGIEEDNENSEEEDEMYEEVFINWPNYNVKKPWRSYGEEIVLFDHIGWIKSMAASQSTLPLMKQIRHAAEPQIIALCEIALNLLMGHIPMTDEDFDCYKGQKDNLRELANADNNWKRNRLLLGSNSTLVWILLVSIEPLYAEEEEVEVKSKPKLKRKTKSTVQRSGWKRYKSK